MHSEPTAGDEPSEPPAVHNKHLPTEAAPFVATARDHAFFADRVLTMTPPHYTRVSGGVPLSYRIEALIIDLFIAHMVAMVAMLVTAMIRMQPFGSTTIPALIYVFVLATYFAALFTFVGASAGMTVYRLRVASDPGHASSKRRRLSTGVAYLLSLGFIAGCLESAPISATRRNLAAVGAVIAFLMLSDVLLSWLA